MYGDSRSGDVTRGLRDLYGDISLINQIQRIPRQFPKLHQADLSLKFHYSFLTSWGFPFMRIVILNARTD